MYNLSSLKKRKISNEITLIDNKENTTFEDHLVSEEFNKFFENVTRGLEINENSFIIDTDSNEINSVEKAIDKYRNHPSVLLIKSRLKMFQASHLAFPIMRQVYLK